MFQTEFDFTLPKGYLDGEGNLHRKGVMKLSKAIDEIVPMKDPRVRANPAYATVIILARVITQLGALEEVSPNIIEELFASDLNYLHQFYRQINDLEEPDQPASEIPDFAPLRSHPEAQSQDIYETS
jgi:phage FluMu protein gp41